VLLLCCVIENRNWIELNKVLIRYNNKNFNKKINKIKVTWRFDDFMPSLSKVKCEKINIRFIYKNRSVKKLKLIFEMLFIRKKRPKLNTQADSIRAKLFV